MNKYKLKIVGKDSKRFVKDLIYKGISLYDIETYNKYSYIVVDKDGFNDIKKIKTSYKIIIVNEYGFIKYKSIFNKYKIFIICLLISFVLLKILSCICFDIRVEHSKNRIRELIMNDLEEFGIKKYHFKVSYNKKEEIKEKILKKETNSIEWLEIDSIGTKYIVKVEERIKRKRQKKLQKQNIIAKKNSMVTYIYAEHGEVKKKINDYVKKGDVLISGIIMNKDTPKTKVRADGKVLGEVWYKVRVELPKEYKYERKTGKKTNKLEIKFLNKSFFLLKNKFNHYNISRTNIINNRILPISFNYSKLEEKMVINRNYSIENIDKTALSMASKKIKNKLNKDDRIIYKKVLKKLDKNSKIEVDIFFKVEEDITDTESIEDLDLEKYEEGGKDESGN